jgi:hypothetical protein
LDLRVGNVQPNIAKALGITMPQPLLVAATYVIE